MVLSLATTLSASEVVFALDAAFPGEGFTVQVTDGQAGVTCDNGARVLDDVETAVATWNNGALARAQAAALATLAANRYAAQVQITYGGKLYASDDTAASRITTIINVLIRAGSTGPVQWKAIDGSYNSMALSDLEAMQTQGANHVEACFEAEAAVDAAIKACTTIDQVAALNLDPAWPA